MEYRFLGRSGLQVSVLSFGTLTFGGEHFENVGNVQLEEARRQIDICIDAGINLFDTADAYSNGRSEELLGAAIGKSRRDQVLISAKCFFRRGDGPNDLGNSRHHIIKASEASLRRLGTDYIDIYHLHGFDNYTPVEETLAALDTLIQQGKVRYVACSNFSGWHLMKSLAIADQQRYQRFIAQQVYYSLLARELEYELIPLALDQGVGTLVWSPLSYGLLSGKFRRNTSKPPQQSRINQVEPPGNINWDRVYNIVDVLAEVAATSNKTIAQVALNWLLQRPSVSSVIVGARNEMQLRENLGAAGWSLTAQEVQKLQAVSDLPEIYPYWHQHKWGLERNPKLNVVGAPRGRPRNWRQSLRLGRLKMGCPYMSISPLYFQICT